MNKRARNYYCEERADHVVSGAFWPFCIFAWVLVILTLFCGCMSPLAEERMVVTREFHAAGTLMVTAGRQYQNVANVMAGKKHGLQREVSDLTWSTWIERHTEDGRLVSMNAAGVIVPMKVEDLAAAIAIRDEHMDRLRVSTTIWNGVNSSWTEALDAFLMTNTQTLNTQESIYQAEKDADDMMQKAIKVLGAVAATAMIGGL